HSPPLPPLFTNDPATIEIYTLSLHDALPICLRRIDLAVVGHARHARGQLRARRVERGLHFACGLVDVAVQRELQVDADVALVARSEEHTSELQSRENLVCRLLLEKKNSRIGG